MSNPFYKLCDYLQEQESQYQLESQNTIYLNNIREQFEDNFNIHERVREDIMQNENFTTKLVYEVYDSARLAKRSIDNKIQVLVHGK